MATYERGGAPFCLQQLPTKLLRFPLLCPGKIATQHRSDGQNSECGRGGIVISVFTWRPPGLQVFNRVRWPEKHDITD